MLKVKIEGLDRVQKKCQSIADKARRAAVVAMTKTAQEIKRAERAKMEQSFDRPTPWVLNSLYVKPATKAKPEARVWIKDEAAKGTPASKILQAEIDGGARRQKRSEKALQAVGILPSGWVAVPTRWAKKDGYGNMDRGQIVQILSHLRAQLGSGYESRLGGKTFDAAKVKKRIAKTGLQYVAIKPGQKNNLPPGIYESKGWSKGKSMRPIMIFAPKANYTVRLRFFDIAQEVIDRDLNRNFNETLRKFMQEDGLI
jgi:hypothetical protein